MKKFLNIPAEENSRRRFFICAAAFALFALCFIGAVVMIVSNRSQTDAARKEYQVLSAQVHTSPSSVDFDLLRGMNPDICAWIVSEGTGIDYPVVQGKDNDFYRRHLFSGKANRFGCLYIDAAQSPDFSAKNTVIFAGAQLESIYRYARQDYYDLLPSMTICTPGGTRTLLLCAGVSAEEITEVVKTGFASDGEFLDYISWLEERSLFRSNITLSENDRIVTLCAVGGEESFVLVGKLA